LPNLIALYLLFYLRHLFSVKLFVFFILVFYNSHKVRQLGTDLFCCGALKDLQLTEDRKIFKRDDAI